MSFENAESSRNVVIEKSNPVNKKDLQQKVLDDHIVLQRKEEIKRVV